MSNLTLGTTAFVALATSADALVGFLGEKPKAALDVMTVIGLLSAILIAVAITLSKALGPSADKISVSGLVLAAALTAAAAGRTDRHPCRCSWDGRSDRRRKVTPVWLIVVAAVVGLIILVYAVRSLHALLTKGYLDNVPAIPDDALKTWAVDVGSSSQREYVEQHIRTAFKNYLYPVDNALTPVGNSLPSTTGDGQSNWRYDYESGQLYAERQSSML